MTTQLILKGRWDSDRIPAGKASRRGLLLEVQVETTKQKAERPPVNLALVIDRSGSMERGRLEAARRAVSDAIGQLIECDRLSVIAFDDEVQYLCTGLAMDAAGREKALAAVASLDTGGCTDLAAGWFAGARSVSDVLEQHPAFGSGHVLVLSDGMANQGERDPEILQRHAAEFAERKIISSCIGVGDDYAPLQLDAIAEGGCGRLHDAADPDEMVVVILKELGEVLEIAARDVTVEVSCPPELQCTSATQLTAHAEAGKLTVALGNLGARSLRTIPLVFEVPAGLVLGARRRIEVTLRANDTSGEPSIPPARESFELLAVTEDEAGAALVDDTVIRQIAAAWSAGVSYQAMRINETGDYAAASDHVREAGRTLRAYIEGSGCEKEVGQQLQLVAQRVSHRWASRSKKEAMIRAKKRSRSERDFRAGKSADSWTDELDRE